MEGNAMTAAEQKVIKLVQQADEERRRRIRAERSASVLKAMNAKLRRELRAVATRDQSPPPDVEQLR
jgi:hypothetical protein